MTWLLLTILLVPVGATAVADELSADHWKALADGRAVAIMRHALAPGTGDPSGLSLDDCSTQRNLSDTGRAQAKQTGDALRDHGIVEADLFSSAWCRCQDTATAMDLGPVETLPALNSFFRDRSTSASQTRELAQWIEQRLSAASAPPAILVTHQVNISALLSEYPTSGETFVVTVEKGELKVLGSFLVAYR